ncbi:DNA polymerase III, delta subunit [seawater metagenome]|uniref:DNA polymerase III, delta subunit n=1 Tax=seawater metagenome TaxID=1561972 RepID=A0A5E8CLJ5_9ZZZZ
MTTIDKNEIDSLPWVEKYRPNKLSKIVHHPNIIFALKKLIKKGQIPHMLFYGASGTGKTSTILATAKKLYDDDINFMVLELNASDDRGINIVREEIKEFAESRNMFKNGIKLIILDEADSMTYDAQFALRRVIEKYSYNTRFCLICNYMNKIIPAIRSRCMQFRFSPIGGESIKEYIGYICEKEEIQMTKKGEDSLVAIAKGDLRKAINLLQSVTMAFDKVTEENCYFTIGNCTPQEIEKLVKVMFDKKKNFKKKYKFLTDMITEGGFSLADILSSFHNNIVKNDILKQLSNSQIVFMFDTLSNIEDKLNYSTFEEIYIGAFVSVFVLLYDKN